MKMNNIKIPDASGILGWSHYCELIAIKDENKRNFYEKETKTSFHGEEMDCSARRCCSDSCSNLLLYCSSRNKHP